MKNSKFMEIPRLKNFRHKPGQDWTWDHPFPGDIGADGRWELSLYRLNDLSPKGFVGYVALAKLEDGRWMVIFNIEGEDRLELIEPTLGKAKAALDQLLGTGTPELPADRDAADPWFGAEAEHREDLWWIQHSEQYRQQLRADVDAELRDLPPPE